MKTKMCQIWFSCVWTFLYETWTFHNANPSFSKGNMKWNNVIMYAGSFGLSKCVIAMINACSNAPRKKHTNAPTQHNICFYILGRTYVPRCPCQKVLSFKSARGKGIWMEAFAMTVLRLSLTWPARDILSVVMVRRTPFAHSNFFSHAFCAPLTLLGK